MYSELQSNEVLSLMIKYHLLLRLTVHRIVLIESNVLP
jgi:hypothetical protein